MIDLGHLVMAVCAGIVLIVFGLVPGLFQDLVQGIRNFENSLTSRYRSAAVPDDVGQPAGLAVVGAIIIAAAVVAYLWT